jgi:hypothetical protein
MVESLGGLLMVVFVALLLMASVAPAIIAFRRKHRNKGLIVLLTALGFLLPATAGLIVWLIALVWSLYKEKPMAEDTTVVQHIKIDPAMMKGPEGKCGKNAYEVYVENWYLNGGTGDVPMAQAEWLESLKGRDAVPLSKAGVIGDTNRSNNRRGR